MDNLRITKVLHADKWDERYGEGCPLCQSDHVTCLDVDVEQEERPMPHGEWKLVEHVRELYRCQYCQDSFIVWWEAVNGLSQPED